MEIVNSEHHNKRRLSGKIFERKRSSKDIYRLSYCGNKHFGKVRRNMYKCYKCKKEWSVRRGSVLEKTKVSFSKFLMALKLFELEISVLKASRELGLSYNTV